ncbi:hypothetical protein NPIL_663751 [Nephila pilipes]|uniref:Uncharacterized protein n=1 Tax=Nephila pilipes TaxID=299642 RepID=A0A8X6QQM7_NEPPI|nr:hypothetical protein NPIL_663751 [Nephila pilipes]
MPRVLECRRGKSKFMGGVLCSAEVEGGEFVFVNDWHSFEIKIEHILILTSFKLLTVNRIFRWPPNQRRRIIFTHGCTSSKTRSSAEIVTCSPNFSSDGGGGQLIMESSPGWVSVMLNLKSRRKFSDRLIPYSGSPTGALAQQPHLFRPALHKVNAKIKLAICYFLGEAVHANCVES